MFIVVTKILADEESSFSTGTVCFLSPSVRFDNYCRFVGRDSSVAGASINMPENIFYSVIDPPGVAFQYDKPGMTPNLETHIRNNIM